jgi:hypothetical protein
LDAATVQGNRFAAFLLANGATLVGTVATDVFVDGIERGDMFERFAGNRRRPGDGEFVEVTPYMRPAERKPDVAALGKACGSRMPLKPSRWAIGRSALRSGA